MSYPGLCASYTTVKYQTYNKVGIQPSIDTSCLGLRVLGNHQGPLCQACEAYWRAFFAKGIRR